jgi:hypothetical protein
MIGEALTALMILLFLICGIVYIIISEVNK